LYPTYTAIPNLKLGAYFLFPLMNVEKKKVKENKIGGYSVCFLSGVLAAHGNYCMQLTNYGI